MNYASDRKVREIEKPVLKGGSIPINIADIELKKKERSEYKVVFIDIDYDTRGKSILEFNNRVEVLEIGVIKVKEKGEIEEEAFRIKPLRVVKNYEPDSKLEEKTIEEGISRLGVLLSEQSKYTPIVTNVKWVGELLSKWIEQNPSSRGSILDIEKDRIIDIGEIISNSVVVNNSKVATRYSNIPLEVLMRLLEIEAETPTNKSKTLTNCYKLMKIKDNIEDRIGRDIKKDYWEIEIERGEEEIIKERERICEEEEGKAIETYLRYVDSLGAEDINWYETGLELDEYGYPVQMINKELEKALVQEYSNYGRIEDYEVFIAKAVLIDKEENDLRKGQVRGSEETKEN